MGNDIRKCYIELLVDERSTEKILRFLKENEDLIQNPRKKFHSTFYYSNYTPIFERERIVNEIKDSLPLTISPESYFFEVFGEENCLALRYENKRVRLLKKKITQEGFRQLTEDFHSSLSYAEIEIKKSLFIFSSSIFLSFFKSSKNCFLFFSSPKITPELTK